MKPDLMLGAPGTGKTHTLIQKILDVKPERFAFISFTRRAANEAKERLRAYYKESELKYVRTLHSLCFELLGLRTTQVFGFKHLRQFGNEYGYEFTGRFRAMEEDSFYNLTEDDIEYRNMQINIAKMILPEHYTDISNMHLRYEQFKGKEKLIDYNDMILQTLKIEMPHINLLLVDEIQDMTPLQLQCVWYLAFHAKQVIFAGDDNQMIFEWAGVDRDKFIELSEQCNNYILHGNYRITGRIRDLAYKVIKRESKKVIGTIGPHFPGYPMVENIDYIDSQQFEFNPKETYMILTRNGYMLRKIAIALDYLNEPWNWIGENLKPSNISLGTIHASKGSEADNVILYTDVSPSTYENIDKDSEHRVWYVGITRAKKKLWVVQPETEMYYDLS